MTRGRCLPRLVSAAVVVGLVATGCTSPGKEPPAGGMSSEARAYLRGALDHLEDTALAGDEVDWPSVRSEAFRTAADARTPADTHAAILKAVRSLGDGHSYFYTPAEAEEITAASGAVTGGNVEGRALPGGIGYLDVRGARGDARALGAFVGSGRAAVAAADRGGACGWIVDLRENQGGNMWPMLTVLGPILGEGRAGSFVGADGKAVPFLIRDGAPRRGKDTWPWAPPAPVTRDHPPVAVLTGPWTASSGEAVAIAFRGRPATRTFGSPTRGIPTGIAPRELPDGAVLGVAQSRIADRTGRSYEGPLQPDEEVPVVREDTGTGGDRALTTAARWLERQPGCR
ncbi:S41 family peptidase [Streptomyces somaliensis DSM 40738]|nr:S41 family peptidase [Streptomyces somaliensis]MCQ0023084.1 S41 family peptidase [Streptomyces somaliensis DSM 40738]